MSFTESIIEDAALGWLKGMGYGIAFGPETAPGELLAERGSFAEVVLAGRLQAALRKLNPSVPDEALEDAFRKVTVPHHPTLIANNRAFHRMLVDGIDVDVRHADGSIRGEKVWLVDWLNEDKNDWLAVNQFTVIEGHHNRRPEQPLGSDHSKWLWQRNISMFMGCF